MCKDEQSEPSAANSGPARDRSIAAGISMQTTAEPHESEASSSTPWLIFMIICQMIQL